MTTKRAGDFARDTPSQQELFEALFVQLEGIVSINQLLYSIDGTPTDYRILAANRHYLTHYCLSKNDVTGKLASEVFGTKPPPLVAEIGSVVREQIPRSFSAFMASLGAIRTVRALPLGSDTFAAIFSNAHTETEQSPSAPLENVNFTAVFEQVPVACARIGAQGEVLSVNRAFCRSFGYDSAELVGERRSLFDLCQFASSHNDAGERILRGHPFEGAIATLVCKDGGRRLIEISGSPIEIPGHRAFLCTLFDVTERSQAETLLRDSEERFRTLFQLSPTPMAIAALDGLRLVELNRAYSVAVGASRTELLANRAPCHFLSSPSVLQSSSDPHKSGGRIEDIEVEYTKPGDLPRLYRISGRLVQHVGQPHIMVSAVDITQLRNAERVAAQSHEQLLRVSELAQIGYFSANIENHSVVWTPEIFRIFGRSPSDYAPSLGAIQSSIVPEDVAAATAVAIAAIEAHTWRRAEFRVRRPNGELRHCVAVLEGTEPSPHHPFHIHGLVQDLTELKNAEADRIKLEQQVMQAQKLESLGVLAGGIAHDFNNLLTSIIGNADLAKGDLPPQSPVRAYLTDIETVSRRAADLCRQMLAYSGKGRFVIRALSLNQLLEEMGHLLSVSVSKKATLEYRLDEHLPATLADAAQLRQVIMNLISNASEALGTDCGTITLSTGATDCPPSITTPGTFKNTPGAIGPYVFLEVRDTGCGMDRDTLGRIFDPFFTTKFTGRGLGLAAVQGIVRGHKGFTEVQSELGKGTTFRVHFPALSESTGAPMRTAQSSSSWRGEGLVLLVDDEPSIRQMGCHMLERIGFQVVVACDGNEALAQFARYQDRIRLVVLDLTMPHLDGEACVTELLRIDPNVKIVLTSGYNEQDVVGRFSQRQLAGFIQKPYTLTCLLSVIREALEPSETNSANVES